MGLRKIKNKTDYVFCGCNARFYFLIFTNFETMTCKYAHLWKHRNNRNTCNEYDFIAKKGGHMIGLIFLCIIKNSFI